MGKHAPEAEFFGPTEAAKIAEDAGYAVLDEPRAEKKHFRLNAKRDGTTLEIDVHRDGRIVDRSDFTAADAKRIAIEAGYHVNADPIADKKHFRVSATKDGKAVDLEVHRDGRVKPDIPFGPADAKKIAADHGYEVVGEPRPEKKHFEVLGKKDGEHVSFDAHRDGELKKVRGIDKSDPKWGDLIR